MILQFVIFKSQSRRRARRFGPAGSDQFRGMAAIQQCCEKPFQVVDKGGIYDHQVVEVNGEKTGGDPIYLKSSSNVITNYLAGKVVSRF